MTRFARGGVDGCSPVLYRGARSGQRANNIGRPRGRVLLALYAFERWRSGMTRTCDLKPFSAQQCQCLKFVALQCVACTATATLRSQIYPRPRTSALRQKRSFTHGPYLCGQTTKDRGPRGYYTAWPSRLFPRPSRDSVSGHIVCGWRRLSRWCGL